MWRGLLLLLVFVVDAAASVLGPYIAVAWHSSLWLSSTTALAAVVTFLGTLYFGIWDDDNKLAMQRAITASVVVTYLLFVCDVTFFGPAASDKPQQLQAIQQALVPSFTLLTGSVLAFYFGSTTLTALANIKQGKDETGKPGDTPPV